MKLKQVLRKAIGLSICRTAITTFIFAVQQLNKRLSTDIPNMGDAELETNHLKSVR